MHRFIVSMIATLFMAIAILPAHAQATFTQGAYEFESYVGSMTYTGSWSTGAANQISYRTINGAGDVSFQAKGKFLVIWRLMQVATSTMNVCVNAVCVAINNTTAGTGEAPQNFIVSLTGGTDTIVITRTAGAILLDSLMILADPALSVPTNVPTATILPSSTPAPTATPLSYVWALDPAKRYGSSNGQISAIELGASAADIHIVNLLNALLTSMWGFFFFGVFVLVRYRADK
jgi:hypothetical protein